MRRTIGSAPCKFVCHFNDNILIISTLFDLFKPPNHPNLLFAIHILGLDNCSVFQSDLAPC